MAPAGGALIALQEPAIGLYEALLLLRPPPLYSFTRQPKHSFSLTNHNLSSLILMKNINCRALR